MPVLIATRPAIGGASLVAASGPIRKRHHCPVRAEQGRHARFYARSCEQLADRQHIAEVVHSVVLREGGLAQPVVPTWRQAHLLLW